MFCLFAHPNKNILWVIAIDKIGSEFAQQLNVKLNLSNFHDI
jgi:hypothetical protein